LLLYFIYLFKFTIKLDKLHVKRKLFNHKVLWFCFRKKSNTLIICKRNAIGLRKLVKILRSKR